MSNSETGMFLGLFCLVTLTITLILYFSLVSQARYHLIAVFILNISDALINIVMIIAIGIGFVQVRALKFVSTKSEHDNLLLLGALGGFNQWRG